MPGRKPLTAAEKSKARKLAKGKKYVAKGKKVAVKSLGKQLSPKRKKQVKGMAQAATAENLISAGRKIQKSGGQGKLAKKSALKVTPKSMHKKVKAGDKNYTGKKRASKARGK